MKNRFLAAAICLLYISVSSFFGVLHRHDGLDPKSADDCAACVWQAGSAVDQPVVQVAFARLEYQVGVFLPETVPAFVSFSTIQPARGPPSVHS